MEAMPLPISQTKSGPERTRKADKSPSESQIEHRPEKTRKTAKPPPVNQTEMGQGEPGRRLSTGL